jgi:hypothetical protein
MCTTCKQGASGEDGALVCLPWLNNAFESSELSAEQRVMVRTVLLACRLQPQPLRLLEPEKAA